MIGIKRHDHSKHKNKSNEKTLRHPLANLQRRKNRIGSTIFTKDLICHAEQTNEISSTRTVTRSERVGRC
jgi:hypothetical protein